MADHRETWGNAARPGRVERLELPAEDVEMTAARLEAIARMMDSAFRIPGTEIVMGFDALLGLIPGIGDAIAGAISSYLIWEAKRLGVPKLTLLRMAGNVAIDTVVGSVPLVGDVFDVAFKANVKNVALLRKHLAKKGYTGRVRDAIDVPYTRV